MSVSRRRVMHAGVLAGYGIVIGAMVVPGVLSALRMMAMLSHQHASSVRFDADIRQWLQAGNYWPGQAWGHLQTAPHWLMTAYVSIGLIGVGVAVLALRHADRPALGGPPASGQGQHGTARWRTRFELGPTIVPWKPGMPKQPSGLVVGRSRRGHAWVASADGHSLIIGATRSGKGRRLVMPTIGVLGSNRTDSMIVTDPKAELYAHTADFLRQQGYRVTRIDFREPRRGGAFNPLHPVITAWHDHHKPSEATQKAWDIAHVLTKSAAAPTDPFWVQAEESLIAALILGVVDQAPAESRHLASVYRTLIDLGREEGKALDQWFHDFPPDHPARLAYGTVALSTSRTRTSILTGAAARLRLFADTDVAWLTSTHTMALADVANAPEVRFLIIPDDKGTRYPIVTLYLTQLIHALNELAQRQGGQLLRSVYFLLDEFANLPAIPDFDKTVAVAAGRGMHFVMVLQDLQQLQSRYGEVARTIQSNAKTWVYLATQDWDTAQLLSRKMGDYTTRVNTVSRPSIGWWRPWTTPVNAGQESEALTGRALLTPDEILRWPHDAALVLETRMPPARLPLPDLSQWDCFQAIQHPKEAWEHSVSVAEDAPPVWGPTSPSSSPTESEEPALGWAWTQSAELDGDSEESASWPEW